MIEVAVVCCVCRRRYRQAKIVPISLARDHIFGTCGDCQPLGSRNDHGGGERTRTVAPPRTRRMTNVARVSPSN
jgi:hypothetical protein